jgi:hypothetical protein
MNLLTKISAIAVTLLFVFTINFKSIVTVSYFVNQSEIIELFCINKEKPQLNCEGKCHLATQLVENEKEETPLSPNNISHNIEISISLLENSITLQPKSIVLDNAYFFNNTPSLSDGYSSILSPPPRG